ncbi:MAG: hypothetical protein ACYCO4_02865 [Sulfobacillus sp.]
MPAPVPLTTTGTVPARSLLWVGLGALWLLDGLLALQPNMYMNMLDVVAMGGWGQPAWMVSLINDGVIQWLYTSHSALLANALLAAVQIAIGGGLILGQNRRWGRYILIGSLPVAAVIWFFGEWAGGVFGLDISLLSGGPGAACLYALIATLLLQPLGWWQAGGRSGRLARWLGWTWLIGAGLQAFPSFWSARSQSLTFLGAAVLTRQGLVTAPINAVARFGGAHPILLNSLLVLVMAALGISLLRAPSGWAWALAVAVALFTWWIGENFGALFSGAGTDPNTGAVWLLLVAAAYVERRYQLVATNPSPPSPIVTP